MKKYDNYKDSGVEWIGEIPKHWDESRLKFNSKIKTGYTPPMENSANYSENGMVWVKPDNLQSFSPVSDSKEKISKEGIKEQNIIPKDSVLLCCIGSIGKFGIAGVDLLTNQQICGVTFANKINSSYGKYLIYCSEDELNRHANGNVVRILNATSLGNILIPIPTISEQTQIANYLDHKTTQIDNLITKKEQFITLLQEERTAVINQAVTKGLDPKVKMKDSGIEWLGEIPEHWEVKPLKHIVKCNNEALSEKTNPQLEIKYIEIGDVSSSTGIQCSTSYPFSEAPSRARRIVREGDVIISTVRTYLKAISSIPKEFDGYIASTGFAVLTPQKISSEYLGFVALTDGVIGEIISMSKGVSYPSITSQDLVGISIPYPNADEQIQIAKYLFRKTNEIDSIISKAQQEIELLKEYKTALISEVVTGKVDVRDVVLN